MTEITLEAYQAALDRMGKRVEAALAGMSDPMMTQFVAILDRALTDELRLNGIMDRLAAGVTDQPEAVAPNFERLMMACTALTVATSFIERLKAKDERHDDGSSDQADHPTRL